MWMLRPTPWRTLACSVVAVRRGAAMGPPKPGPLALLACRPRDTYLDLVFGVSSKPIDAEPGVRRADEETVVSGGDEEEGEGEEVVVSVDYVWLRDHCRAHGSSVRVDTGQRLLDTASIPLDVRPRGARVHGDTLTLTWLDGHVSEYAGSWLFNASGERQRHSLTQPHTHLWDWLTLQRLAHHDPAVLLGERFAAVLDCEDALRRVLHRLLLLGFAVVRETPPTMDATRAVAERLSFIRETVFGRMWEFSADGERSDTAYTAESLDRHTDTTYLHEPARVQVFHVLRGADEGGRTLLVDGFGAAWRLHRRRPDAFAVLARVPVTHEFSEGGAGAGGGDAAGGRQHRHLLRATHTVVGTTPTANGGHGELLMMCYNNYDRVSLAVSGHEEARRWYHAHRHLTALLRQPSTEAWFQLQPGTVLLIDNWRVLHGREAFLGPRRVCGCYLPHDDLMDTARRLGLLA
ncbi:trimethyllysine dioxygenase, mitochondrial [Petromyzon marinus]|uniref:trimethyllysine dioxygenase, mitochondrial n=1 Tax=Petromyzon marinus TaxID=7757 RepID=UPI003F7166DC